MASNHGISTLWFAMVIYPHGQQPWDCHAMVCHGYTSPWPATMGFPCYGLPWLYILMANNHGIYILWFAMVIHPYGQQPWDFHTLICHGYISRWPATMEFSCYGLPWLYIPMPSYHGIFMLWFAMVIHPRSQPPWDFHAMVCHGYISPWPATMGLP